MSQFLDNLDNKLEESGYSQVCHRFIKGGDMKEAGSKSKKAGVGFNCPICGSSSFGELTENNGIMGSGARSWVIFYICDGCSVMFNDPKKFSKQEQV